MGALRLLKPEGGCLKEVVDKHVHSMHKKIFQKNLDK